jgi:hypothetical protein
MGGRDEIAEIVQKSGKKLMAKGVAGLLLGVAVVFGVSCQRPPATEYRLNATVRDIMQSMVDPSADVVWNSVATIQDKCGTDERRPKTDEEWETVRHHALIVAEATNLLVMPGRRMARPGQRSGTPEVELNPEEIEALVNQDRKVWIDYAHGLNDQIAIALKAIEAKDAKALFDVGEEIDGACEQCHRHYWYPPDANKRK